MKYFLPLILLAGCTGQPSQEDIEQAASRQIAQKSRCELVAQSLGLTSDVSFDGGHILCELTGTKAGLFLLSDGEAQSILRYLAIKERIAHPPKKTGDEH